MRIKATVGATATYSDTQSTIGSYVTGISKYTGSVDNFRVYDKSLSMGSAVNVGDTAGGELLQNDNYDKGI